MERLAISQVREAVPENSDVVDVLDDAGLSSPVFEFAFENENHLVVT